MGALVGCFGFAALFEGVAAGLLGSADFEEGEVEGAAGRSLERLVPAEAEARPVGEAVCPPWVSRSGAPPERTWSADELPRTSKVSPPGSRPEVTATAPTAMAAETPRRPVRTGIEARFLPWRPMRCAFHVLRTPSRRHRYSHEPHPFG
ncbi:hypothetical protein [Streptomyces finlayi]|uniref:hypothetical protein n=1 Tax=Streptomyces finlayi TaxID=67296 RepID=UPI00215658A3|nr:hypothetical protein [Streptomyces finlayi]